MADKRKYEYIPQKDIQELSALLKGELVKFSNAEVLDGAYVKRKSKSTNTSDATEIYKKILAYGELHEEDKKEFESVSKHIKVADIQFFQKYLTNDLIISFYCGVRASFEFKGDYEMSELSGIFRMRDSYIKKFITKAKKLCTKKEFEIGLKYPDYDFEKLLGKPKEVKTIKGKSDGWYQYDYKVWVWDSCVAGKSIGYQRFKDGKKDGEYQSNGNANEFNLRGGYLSFVSSDATIIDVILIYMQADKKGYVKDVEVINNGLGGVTPETLKKNKVKFAKGGKVKVQHYGHNLHDFDVKDKNEANDRIEKLLNRYNKTRKKTSNYAIFYEDGNGKITSWQKMAKGGETYDWGEQFEQNEDALSYDERENIRASIERILGVEVFDDVNDNGAYEFYIDKAKYWIGLGDGSEVMSKYAYDIYNDGATKTLASGKAQTFADLKKKVLAEVKKHKKALLETDNKKYAKGGAITMKDAKSDFIFELLNLDDDSYVDFLNDNGFEQIEVENDQQLREANSFIDGNNDSEKPLTKQAILDFTAEIEEKVKDGTYGEYDDGDEDYAKGGSVEYFTMKDGSKMSKEEWYRKMEDKLGFFDFAKRILNDSQFSQYTNLPKKEFRHNREKHNAIIEKDYVELVGFATKDTPSFSKKFHSLRDLQNYLQENNIYAKGGKISKADINKTITDFVKAKHLFDIELTSENGEKRWYTPSLIDVERYGTEDELEISVESNFALAFKLKEYLELEDISNVRKSTTRPLKIGEKYLTISKDADMWTDMIYLGKYKETTTKQIDKLIEQHNYQKDNDVYLFDMSDKEKPIKKGNDVFGIEPVSFYSKKEAGKTLSAFLYFYSGYEEDWIWVQPDEVNDSSKSSKAVDIYSLEESPGYSDPHSVAKMISDDNKDFEIDIDGMAGTWYLSPKKFSGLTEFTIMATPFWDAEYGTPIEITDNDGVFSTYEFLEFTSKSKVKSYKNLYTYYLSDVIPAVKKMWDKFLKDNQPIAKDSEVTEVQYEELKKSISQGVGSIDEEYIGESFARMFGRIIGEEDIKLIAFKLKTDGRLSSSKSPTQNYTSNISSKWSSPSSIKADVESFILDAQAEGSETLVVTVIESVLAGIVKANEYLVEDESKEECKERLDAIKKALDKMKKQC